MEQKVLEEVMIFLKPHYKFVAYLVLKQKKEELDIIKKMINCGITNGKINFYHSSSELDIDLKKIEQRYGRKWVEVLKKQLKHITEVC